MKSSTQITLTTLNHAMIRIAQLKIENARVQELEQEIRRLKVHNNKLMHLNRTDHQKTEKRKALSPPPPTEKHAFMQRAKQRKTVYMVYP